MEGARSSAFHLVPRAAAEIASNPSGELAFVNGIWFDWVLDD